MKRMFALTIGLLAVAGSAFAQTSTMDADTIVLAAPANLRAGATVIRWHADHAAYDTVKQGNNKLVCYDRSGFPEQQAFSIECTSQANLERVKQNLKIEAGGDKNKSNDMVAAEEKDGSRVKPEYGSVFYHLMGPSKDQAHTHMTICVPGATAKTLPFPETAAPGVVWIMDAGTSGAHLMTPGE
jgi:hypothetical protein